VGTTAPLSTPFGRANSKLLENLDEAKLSTTPQQARKQWNTLNFQFARRFVQIGTAID
jgi:hypothetical protein